MTLVRVLIELPGDARLVEFETELIALSKKYGTNVARSPDPRMPLHYDLRQMHHVTFPRENHNA